MTTKRLSRADTPLRCSVRRGVLTIEIGVGTNAWACLHSEYVWLLEGRPARKQPKHYRITDNAGFAKDVVRALLDEAEDGSSLLTKLFDDACRIAIEDGAEHFMGEDDE